MKITTILLLATALAVSACGKSEPKYGQLTQRFVMVDADGRQFGTVEMDPVGGGRITDVSGRIVGEIYPPQQQVQQTAMAAPAGYVQ